LTSTMSAMLFQSRYAYPALIAASCDFNSPLSRSSAPNINHELETLEQVSIGAQQCLDTLTRYLPMILPC